MPDFPDEDFARLTFELNRSSTVDDSATLIVAYGMRFLDAPFAGVTMRKGRGRFETVGHSAPVVLDADRHQRDLREGPNIQASTTAQVTTSADLSRDKRWPTWGPVVVALGLRSVLSAELHASGRHIGALALYRGDVRHHTPEDMDLARLFARHAAAALAAVSAREGLERALQTRTVIGQAQGILMERFEIDADAAFATLRRYSQDKNIGLAEVARHLLNTSDLPDDMPVPRSRHGSRRVEPVDRRHTSVAAEADETRARRS